MDRGVEAVTAGLNSRVQRVQECGLGVRAQESGA